MVTIVVPGLFAVVGLLVYALSTHPKVAEMGRICFLVGLFWALGAVSRSSIHF